jgi:hypothetical protein
VPADFSKRRRRIYQAKLTATETYFKGLLSAAPFNPQVDVARMQAAVIDPELVEALAEILDIYALYGISRDFERLDETKALLVTDRSQRLPLDQAIPPRDKAVRAITNPAAGLSTDVLIRRYFDWYIDVDDVGDGRSGVAAFLARYPLLAYAMDTGTDHHQKNIRDACQRITNDWGTIRDAFFSGDTIIKLSEIRTTGNDFHKGGKQVLILSFSLAKSDDPGRVVYKPSSVEIDCRIVGDSAVVNQCKPQGYTQQTSLTELLNRHYRGRLLPRRRASAPLPTYTVLPYNRGSIPDAYGYIEFLARDPVVEGPFTDIGDILAKQAAEVASLELTDVQKSDWVVADPASERVFYHQVGRLIAMVLALSLFDLHVQNVIVHKKSPCLIDLEEALKLPMTNFGDTGLAGAIASEYDPEGSVLEINEKPGGLPRAEWGSPAGKPATSRLYRWTKKGEPGRPVTLVGNDAEGNRLWLMRGLIDGVETMAEPNCNADVQNWVKSLGTTIARFVSVGTKAYAIAGRDLFQKCCETSIDPRAMSDFEFGEIAYLGEDKKTKKYFFPEQIALRRKDWEIRYERYKNDPPLLHAWRAHPFFALENPDCVWRDYLNCDVPSFYHRLGSLELLTSAGAPANVTQAVDWQSTHVPSAARDAPLPQAWKPNQGGTYLPETPIDMVVNQLEWLAKACEDPADEHAYLAEVYPAAVWQDALVKVLFPAASQHGAAV